MLSHTATRLAYPGQARAFAHGGRRNLVTGRPGLGCRPLRALILAQHHRNAVRQHLRPFAGRNTQRCPLLRDVVPLPGASRLHFCLPGARPLPWLESDGRVPSVGAADVSVKVTGPGRITRSGLSVPRRRRARRVGVPHAVPSTARARGAAASVAWSAVPLPRRSCRRRAPTWTGDRRRACRVACR